MRPPRRCPEGIPPIREVLDRYQERVVRYCLRVLGCPSEAGDCAQEVFWRVYRSLPSFRGEASLTTWIYAITRQCCLLALRRREARGRRETRLNSGTDRIPSRERSPVESTLREEARELFRNIFHGILDEKEAHIMCLHYVEGKTTATIDRELRLPNRSGSKAYLVSALRKLRKPHVRARLRLLELATSSRSHR